MATVTFPPLRDSADLGSLERFAAMTTAKSLSETFSGWEEINHRLPKEGVDYCLIHGRNVLYSDGQLIQKQGDVADCFFLIVDGRVRVRTLLNDGREMLNLYLYPGQHFGALSLMDGGPRVQDCIAIGNVTVVKLSKEQFSEMLREYPQCEQHLMRQHMLVLRFAMQEIQEFAYYAVPTRLAKKLLQLTSAEKNSRVGDDSDPNSAGEVSITQDELASMVGASRKAVGAVLRAWRRQGYISFRYGRLRVLDIDGLTKEGRPNNA